MFSCKTNLQFHSSIDVLYVDWTFKSGPKFFHQLFTIHGLSNGHYVPLAYFLLVKKLQTSYEDVFSHTVSQTEKLGMTVFQQLLKLISKPPFTTQCGQIVELKHVVYI
jgi:hypothetical protein